MRFRILEIMLMDSYDLPFNKKSITKIRKTFVRYKHYIVFQSLSLFCWPNLLCVFLVYLCYCFCFVVSIGGRG